MAKEYYHLFVVMSDAPRVTAVFESRRKAEEHADKMNAASTHYRYYIDTSFHNVFED